MRRRRPSRHKRLLLAVLIVPVICATMGGCPDWTKTATNAGIPSFEQGFISILTGVVNGIYAVLLPGNTNVPVPSSSQGTQPNQPNSP